MAVKTEHAGAKNGGSAYYGQRAEAKRVSKKIRRVAGRKAAQED